MNEINNSNSNTFISGTNGDDDIDNWGSNVTINTGAGNDSIWNTFNTEHSSINGGSGDDAISNGGSYVTIIGGKGNDSIFNGAYLQYDGSISYLGSSGNFLFKYSSGDGNDTIWGFNSISTLSIVGSSYSSIKSGNDIIFTVGDGKISLIGAATLDSVNVKFKKTSTNTNSWKLSGSTATYGTYSKTLVTITGVKSTNGLSISGKTVTIANSALNQAKVTISNGYTLALASDVAKTSNKKAWSLKNSTATYNQTTTAGYKLASDAKSITYTKKSTKNLVTVSGIKSTSGLSVSGKVVTVSKAALNASKITINNGYTLALASDVPTPTAKKAAWTYKNSVATYKSASTTAGYTLSNDSKSITYSKAKSNSTLAKITGAKSKNGFKVSGKTIKLAASSLSKKVSVSGSYAFEFAADYKNALITGSNSNDTIKALGANTTINGGKGNDSLIGGTGKDIFIYSSGDGNDIITNFGENDVISIKSGTANVSTSGNDVIFTVGKGKITLKGANGKNITYFDADGNENIYPEPIKQNNVIYDAEGTSATLKVTYSADKFEPSDYGAYKDIILTIDSSAVRHSLEIKGNKNANKIVGTEEEDTIYGGAGKDTILGGDSNDKLYGEAGNDSILGGNGSDTLWGGAGDDILTGGDGFDTFIYNENDGNDTITDYSPGVDTVMVLISNAKIGNPRATASDVTFKIGTGQITFKNSANKYIELVDKAGNELKHYNPN